MKFMGAQVRLLDQPSLPVRGAWIEIFCFSFARPLITSLPVRGAWIEMMR